MPKLSDYAMSLLRVMLRHHRQGRGVQLESRRLAAELGEVDNTRLDDAVAWLIERGYVIAIGFGPTSGRIVQMKPSGVEAAEELEAREVPTVEQGVMVMSKRQPQSVFIVHGRNIRAYEAMRDFLRSLGLQPIDFDKLVADMGGSPFVGNVVREGLERAQAMMVIFTPDEHAELRQDLHGSGDKDVDRARWQARPNVIYEAGLAMGIDETRTILVTIGTDVSLFSDADGRHVVRMDDSSEKRNALRLRLEGAKCAVDAGSDWLKTGDFAAAIAAPADVPRTNQAIEGSPAASLVEKKPWAAPAESRARASEPLPPLVLKVERQNVRTDPDVHSYQLVTTITNTTDHRIDDWELAIEIPTAFLTSTSYGPLKVESESNATKTMFVWNQSKVADKVIRPEASRTLKIDYVVTKALYARRDELFGLPVKVTASVDGRIVERFTKSIGELQEF